MNFFKRKYRKGVFIVVYKIDKDEIKYFIEKRKLHWKGFEFPKGGVEKGEKLNEAAIRETTEETGLKIIAIKNHKLKGKYVYSKELKDRKGIIGQTWTLFSARVEPGRVKLDNHEHSGYLWLNYEKALMKLTYENQKKCLKKVNEWIKKNK